MINECGSLAERLTSLTTWFNLARTGRAEMQGKDARTFEALLSECAEDALAAEREAAEKPRLHVVGETAQVIPFDQPNKKRALFTTYDPDGGDVA